MKAYGDKNYNKPYSVDKKTDEKGRTKKENCADLAGGVGKAGGVNVSSPQSSVPIIGSFTDPNKQYEQTEENNKGTEINLSNDDDGDNDDTK